MKRRNDWVYLVLTFRQPDDTIGRWRTYLKAGKSWDAARKRLSRLYGKLDYVQTLERHKRGGCHVNLLVGNTAVSRAVADDWRGWRKDIARPLFTAVGFGPVLWVQICNENAGAISGYLTKLAAELTGGAGKYQIPEDAPPHFRRLRASRGLLPPKPETEYTGELVPCPLPEYNGQDPACGTTAKEE